MYVLRVYVHASISVLMCAWVRACVRVFVRVSVVCVCVFLCACVCVCVVRVHMVTYVRVLCAHNHANHAHLPSRTQACNNSVCV